MWRLIGFCRSLPEVCTFATPVFEDEAGQRWAQQIDDLGIVRAVQAIETGEEFLPTSFERSICLGEAAIWAFEVVPNVFMIGTGGDLAEGLRAYFEFANPHNPTETAVLRFIAFVRANHVAPKTGFLSWYGLPPALRVAAQGHLHPVSAESAWLFKQAEESWHRWTAPKVKDRLRAEMAEDETDSSAAGRARGGHRA